ncbi:MAG: NAD(P)-binding protein, partial [Elusimicrobiales bacterium]|nr:NAD(P)-binding protein [Elusimicrobiales bacterium]
MSKFDFIIVGAGFCGSVIAERIANVLKRKVLIIEKREHIGGNCYDFKNEFGINVHKYGPHIFHTDDDDVFRYISNFTDWHFYEHKPLAFVDGKKIPIPVNFNTIDIVFQDDKAKIFKENLLYEFGPNKKVPVLDLMKSSNIYVKEFAIWVYEKIFVNYTAKQWGKKPHEI